MNTITVKIINTPEEAPNYSADHPEFKTATLTNALIVKQGTEGGNPTVDLQFVDSNGQKYIALVTGALLESLGTAISASKEPQA